MTRMRFDDRVIIVTGAGGGLGEVYAKLLAKLGASVVLMDLGNAVDRVTEEIVKSGGKALAFRGSVSDETAATEVVDVALAEFGRVDGLINNAGIGFERPFMDTSVDDIRRVMEVHYFGTVAMTKAVWPHMKRAGYGRILNITSANVFGLEGWAPYAAAKGAVLSLGRTLALEGKADGIKVNVLAPAALTSMLVDNIKDPDILASVKNARPELVGPVAAYLVHEDVPFTGRTLFSAAGHVASILMGTTQGVSDEELTIEKVADFVAGAEMDQGFRSQSSTVEQTTAGSSS